MTADPMRPYIVQIVPCGEDPRCFRWIIREDGGTVVEQSPYAFLSQNGARISGECWKREHFDDQRRR
jgi:hypothetical protein